MFAPIFCILTGIIIHLIVWNRGTWDAHIGRIVYYAGLTHIILSISLAYMLEDEVINTQKKAFFLEALHLIGTFASITVYRVYFHPLRHFPGPLGAKIWIWDIFVRTWKSENGQSVVIDRLHAKYGPIVRYAPDRLSIDSAAAIALVHGTGSTSPCTKSIVYLNPVNGGSLNADRDVTSHHTRRKIWERALSTRALSRYVLPITQLTSSLVASLVAADTKSIIVNRHVQLFTFDAMGLIGFGRKSGFDGLTSGILHPAITELIDMMDIGVYMMLVPWLHVLLDYVPTMGIIYKPDELFREFAKETLSQYCEVTSHQQGKHDEEAQTISSEGTSPDYKHSQFKDILNQIHPHPSLNDNRTLSDCVLLSIAGADTTTSSLVHSIYRLAKHKDMQAIIHEEIDLAQPPLLTVTPDTTWNMQFATWIETAKLPYLESFIREVLRLHPPGPTGLPRQAPEEGLTLSNADGSKTLVPGNTNISVPVYTVLRSPHNFVRPLDFLPQRFLPAWHPAARPDLILDSRAYIPFLQGPYGCPGKHLAYLEMKIVIAGILSAFTVVFPDSKTVSDIDRTVERGWRDYSTVKAADVQARFLPRKVFS